VRPVHHIHFGIRKDSLMYKRLLPRSLTLIVFGLTSIVAACGDDSSSIDDAVTGDSGTPESGKGAGGKGGKGGSGSKAGSGGETSTSDAGTAGSGGSSSGGRGGSTSTPTTPTMPVAECTEEAPPAGFKCGDEVCEVPTFAMNTCIAPCCIEVNGKPTCGAKSTSTQFPAACSLPPVADPTCPVVAGAMGGAEMAGCCNAELGKCGIISSARPGCITESMFVEIPDQACTPPATGDSDAGVEEPDAG
jgi:hypothetical protein